MMLKILGPLLQEDGSWRERVNQEIEALVAEANIMGEGKGYDGWATC